MLKVDAHPFRRHRQTTAVTSRAGRIKVMKVSRGKLFQPVRGTLCERSATSPRGNLERGFTVIEIMVTLAIAALLMFAVAPSLVTWIGNMQVRASAEAIQTGLQRARMEAVRRNRNVQFSLVSLTNPTLMDNSCAQSSASGSWVISINDPDSKCGAAPSDDVDPMIIETRAAGASAARVTVAAVRADGATAAEQVTFDGFGRLADTTSIARIDINNAVASNDYRPLRIVIASGGGVRMCEPRVTDTTDPRHC